MHITTQNGVLMLRYNLWNSLVMDSAIFQFQTNNTLALAMKVIVCSQMNFVMVQKSMIVKTSALAQKQHSLFTIILQRVANRLAEHKKMRMIMNTMVIVEKGKMQYSITINATPRSCQEI